MVDAPSQPTGDAGKPAGATGKKESLIRRMTPKGGARQTIGVIVLLTVVAVAVAALVLGVERSRANYFQQRNLRELDRVATNIGATSQTLGSVASLYFNPAQLQFSLTPGTECLMASTRIQRTADLAIDINYYFVDAETPSTAPRIGSAKPQESRTAPAPAGDAGTNPTPPPATPPAATVPAPGKTNEPLRAPAPAATAAVTGECPYGAPISSAGTGETLTVDGERIRLTEWLLLRDLLRPMVSSTGAAQGADPAAAARAVLERAAADRIERGGFGPRPGTDVPDVVHRSVQTAFERNAIRTEVIVSTHALDLGTSLETFDAVQILGTPEDEKKPPPLLFQAGQLPPAITGGDAGASRDFLKAITSAGAGSGAAAAQASKDRAYQESAGSGSLLMESKVYPAGDLMIFDKRYADLGGFDCTPTCRIIGVIKDQRFGNDVRRFEGMHSTFFLIAVMTLVGLVPMIHLALRKRLDAVGRRAQYVMWFSLTLLAASAIVASLTVWAGAVSKSASTAYAEAEMQRIKTGFARELKASLRLIAQLGETLPKSEVTFPAPPDVHWKAGIPGAGRNAVLLDTTGYFRGDGYAVRNLARFSDVRSPPFGTNVADRPYFNRARNGDFEEVRLSPGTPCPGPDGKHRFVIDRVVARPDGVAKTIIMMPQRPGCSRAAPTSDAEAANARSPSQPQFLLASGYLQTFIAAATDPGFSFAVIDPGRPEGEPDILFSSRRSAELSEEFERDLDDKEGFRTRMEQFRLAADADALRRLETHYRGDPVRLTMSRLHPSVDWVLVVIEGRNDAGFAVWRAATFGYFTWLVALIVITLAMAGTRLIQHKALDRRPGLWLWPVDVIIDFSPARFAYEPRRRRVMGEAAIRRDRHLLTLFFAGLVGIFAAEAAARTFLAFGVIAAAFAARAYFGGSTSSNWPASRRLDRFFIYAAAAFLAVSVLAFATAALTNYAGEAMQGQWVRTFLFLVAVAVTIVLLGDALEAAAEPETRASRAGTRIVSLSRRLRRMARDKAWQPTSKLHGWMFFLLAIGSLPAAAGYLDSIDHDSALVAERAARIEARGAEQRAKTLASIDIGRRAGVAPGAAEKAMRERIVEGGLPGQALLRADPEKAKAKKEAAARVGRGDWTIAYFAMRALDLHEMALNFSDFRPWHMRDGFARVAPALWVKFVLGVLGMLLPFLLLVGGFIIFRRQYFTAAPRTPAIDPVDFSAPLSAAREDFVKKLLVPAARGGAPKVPFEKDPTFRHVILGIDLDVKGDPDLDGVHDLIEWVDMLKIAAGTAPPETIDAKKKAVVVGNLDIALQLPDQAAVKAAFEGLAKIVETARPGENKRHLFVLSDIAPMDRIALMRERAEQDEAPTRIEDWRWATLLQDFTLVAVMPTTPLSGVTTGDDVEPPTAAERELMVINTNLARSLLAQLRRQRKLRGPDEYQDRVIDYVAEQMADYYHKLWAASSDEERVLLYHIAWRCHLKMTEGPALRSLLVRGLIVRSPEYRLMNKSFARYVRRVERLDKIKARAAVLGGLDNIWPVIRVPLMVFTLALLVIVQLISPRHATGALGIVPALGAIVPALLANWLRMKAAEA